MKLRLLWIAIAVVVVGAVGFRVREYRQKNAVVAEKAVETALIQATTVTRSDLTERLLLTGNVRPRNEVDIFAKIPGRIEAISAEVGDKVKAGQVLASIEHKEIAWQAKAAEASTRIAKANLDGAKQDLDRVTMLFQGGSATQAQLDGTKLKVSMAEAQLAQAEAAGGLAQQNLDNSRITAPIGGTVTRRPVNLGNQVGPQSPMFTVQDLQALKLESSVDASAFARLSKGQEASVTVDAIPSQVFRGELTLLAPALDATTRRAACEIQIDNANGKLLANGFARADLRLGTLKNVLTVPKEAVLEAPGGAVVFLIRQGHAQVVRPKLGSTDGARFVVEQGLNEGDVIAASGVANLTDGAPVKIADVPAHAPAPAPAPVQAAPAPVQAAPKSAAAESAGGRR